VKALIFLLLWNNRVQKKASVKFVKNRKINLGRHA